MGTLKFRCNDRELPVACVEGTYDLANTFELEKMGILLAPNGGQLTGGMMDDNGCTKPAVLQTLQGYDPPIQVQGRPAGSRAGAAGVGLPCAASNKQIAAVWSGTLRVVTLADALTSCPLPAKLRAGFDWEGRWLGVFKEYVCVLQRCETEGDASSTRQVYSCGAMLIEEIARTLLGELSWQRSGRGGGRAEPAWRTLASVFVNQRAADKTAPDVAWCGLWQGVVRDAQHMYKHLQLVLEYKARDRMEEADGIAEGLGQLISWAWAALEAQQPPTGTIWLPGAVLDNEYLVAALVHHAQDQAQWKLYRSEKQHLCHTGTNQVNTESSAFKDLVYMCWLTQGNLIRAGAEAQDVCMKDGDIIKVLSTTGAVTQYTLVRRLGTPGPAGCAYQATDGAGDMVVVKVGPPPALALAAAQLGIPAAPWSQVRNEARLSAVMCGRRHPALATCITSGRLQLPSTSPQATWIDGADAVVVAPCGTPLVAPGGAMPVMAAAEVEQLMWDILGGLAVLQEVGIHHCDVHARNMGMLTGGQAPHGGNKHSTPALLTGAPVVDGVASSSCSSMSMFSTPSSSTGASSSTSGSTGSNRYYLFDLGHGVTTAEVAAAASTQSSICVPQDLLLGALEVVGGQLPGPLSDAQALLFTGIALTGQSLPWEAAAQAGDSWGCQELRRWFMANPLKHLEVFSPALQQLASSIFNSCIQDGADNFSLSNAIAHAQDYGRVQAKAQAPEGSPAQLPSRHSGLAA